MCVPTLDEERRLPRLLARLASGAPDDRADVVVVADGGSADRTRALAEDGGCLVVDAERGRGAQLAAGARRLDTALLLFLHADCLPEPGALAALRRALSGGTLVAAGMRQRVDAQGLFYRLVERAADRRTARGVVLGDAGLCARRDAYERAGGFAPLPLFEDVELCRRLRALGRVGLVREATLRVSARRWRAEGALRCTLRNRILWLAHAAGVPPRRLARLYRPHADRSASEPPTSP